MLNPESPSTAPALIDPASKAFQSLLDKLAPTEATVLIVGETGTGKEVVARYLHHHSARRQQPFLAVNCGALTESLAEAELFGHEKGAFTGAQQGQPGWFEAAEGGTLLLDEIGELSLPLQVKLLRVLQEREITRVGSRKAIKVNVRVIAATHVDLAQAIRERRFREDLYYRLNIAVVPLPPLRQRRQDIPLLAHHFLSLYARRLGRPTLRLAPESLARLMDYSWPGNIRELENTLHNAVLLSKEEEISPAQLRLATLNDAPGPASDHELDDFIRHQLALPGEPLWQRVTSALIRHAMAHCDDNQSQAAALLGISRHTLRTQLANLGLIKSRRRPPAPPRAFANAAGADRELRIGYQRFGSLGILKARQSLETAFASLGVNVLWSEFPAGPQLLHALACNEIDFGTTGEAPPVFAQASNSELMYVAWEPPAPRSVAMVVPQESDIRQLSDLRGKRIALNKGSNVHWLLLQILEDAGLGLNDVRVVYTPPKYPRIFRRGIDHPHIVQTQAGVLEDLQQQPVDIRPFIEGDAFTAQIAELANVALLRDDHRHAARRRRLPRHVHQFAIAGLGKHRRRFSGGAEVDLVAGEGVEELRSGRKLTPQHVDAEAGEGGFQTLTGFQDPEAAEALVANAQFAIGPGCVGERPRRRRRAAAAFDQPEVSELGAQGMPADPQQRGRLALVIVAMRHGVANQGAGHSLPQRLAGKRQLVANKVVQFMIARRPRGVVERRQAQLGRTDLLFFTEQHRVVQGVFQLANIARPRIVHQPGQ